MKREHQTMSNEHQNIEEQYNKLSVYQGTRSKIQDTSQLKVLKEKKQALWVSATKTYNALTSNHLVDWLNLYGLGLLESVDTVSNQFLQFLFKRGHDFEDMIVNNIVEKTDVVKIANYYSLGAVQNTLKYMQDGTPVIWSAPLANTSKATYGITDLLIRSDMFAKLFKVSPLTEEEAIIPAPKLNKPYHYRVVEVKYCTVPLVADNRHILNYPKFVAYKGQLNVYNDALGKLQGYLPPAAYILGRRTTCGATSGAVSTKSAFDQMGVVDFTDHDKDIVLKTKAAIEWYRKVQRRGASWSIDPPTREELFPNMGVESGKWDPVKRLIAEKIGDITMLWRCGNKHRQLALDGSVGSFTDEGCDGKLLGFKEGTMNSVDNIISVNTTAEMIKPITITVSNDLKQSNVERRRKNLYVDFETFTDICQDIGESPDHNSFTMIFMIGIGWTVNGIWNHQTFIADTPTIEAEFNLISRFQTFIKHITAPPSPTTPTAPTAPTECPILFYWHADKSMWKQALGRHNITEHEDSISLLTEWCNLTDVFITKSIAVKGAYDYKLKNIAAAMKKNGMIQTNLEADCTNGAMAMIRAWQCYQKYQVPTSAPIMKDIVRYNQYDCKVMYDILKYLRRNIFVELN